MKQTSSPRLHWYFCAILFAYSLISFLSIATADEFVTPATNKTLGADGFAQWENGVLKPYVVQRGVAEVLVTQTTPTSWHAPDFGVSNRLGVRHLRIPLNEEIPVGTLLIYGQGYVSVLKPGNDPAKADPADESLWIPGRRVFDPSVTSSEEGLDRGSYAFWVFPPGTKTRAFRFSHSPLPTDREFSGWLGGIYVLKNRYVNVAPRALPVTSAELQKAERLIDGLNNGWQTWDNGEKGAQLAVSAERPESAILVWDEPAKLRGVGTIWSGFGSAAVDVYVGPENVHPKESKNPADWKEIAASDKVAIGYGIVDPNWFDFGQTITTRAVRLRMMSTTPNTHEHIVGGVFNGKRIWLGEIFAMTPLGDTDDLLAAMPKKEVFEDHPPIPIRFTLPEDALVTLVVEKEDGTRVRNLIADKPFSKGENTVYWDGSNDLLRDTEASLHGLYNLPKQLVEPGTYQVRGLYHPPIRLRYEMSVYNEGTPTWSTADNTGGWLTNHTPPSCALWVPAENSVTGSPLVYLGSYVSEGGHGLAWFDVQADKDRGILATKKGGVGWVGGNWTGAQHLTRDLGQNRVEDHYMYVASAWGMSDNNHDENQNGEVRVSALRPNGSYAVVKYTFKPKKFGYGENGWGPNLGGVAVHDGVAVLSMSKLNQLVCLDVKDGKVLDTIDWESPGGVAFDKDGSFYVLSNNALYRLKERPKSGVDYDLAPFIANLDAPKSLTFDTAGNIYISENGKSHHVRVFNPAGRQLRTIGKTGVPAAGPYDELRMNHPAGMTIDGEGRLWVTENDFQPKRVSVWTKDGKLVRAFYGPSEYGGGGQLDSVDPTRFFYHGMEFQLDRKQGTSKLVRVYYRVGDENSMPDGHHSEKLPEMPLYPQGKNGPRYFTNCFNSNPTNGVRMAGIWFDDPKTGIARLVGVMGDPQNWSVFKEERFKPFLPQGIDLEKAAHQNRVRVIWCDLNGDGKPQPEETRFEVGSAGGVTVGVSNGQLHYVATRVTDARDDGQSKDARTVLYRSAGFADNTPKFDFASHKVLATGVHVPQSTGGDQALYDVENDRTILTLGIAPYSPYSLSGAAGSKAVWSYPNVWPGLHASHHAPPHQFPGQIVGPTRLLGDFVKTGYSKPVFALNGNHGTVYLFGSDGLFVTRLFGDNRLAPGWRMPIAEKDMDITGISLSDENFWPSITQSADGNIYLVDGGRSSLVRVEGLESVRDIKPIALKLTEKDLQTADNWLIESENRRQNFSGKPTLKVALEKSDIKLDGNLDDWSDADWATIDRSGIAAYFDANSKPYDISAALAVSKDKLVAAFRTNLRNPLENTGELPNALFKTGGCLDIMIGVNPDADPTRRDPVAGDMRILVSMVAKKPKALLYRAVVSGTKEPIPFSSPWQTVTFDQVDDISHLIEFAEGENGVYEIAIPLELLGLKPAKGMSIRGDVGLLRGNDGVTVARTYWSNKATAITSDVPSEARLTPSLWGTWVFE